MTIENQGTTASVNVRSGAKVNRGNYQSEDASVGFSLEFDLAGATFEEALNQLVEIESHLQEVTERLTAEALGLTVGADGIGFGSVAQTPAAAAAATQPAAQSQGSSPAGDFAPPKVAKEDKTQLIIGGEAWYDDRPFKASGQYSSKAADFRSVQGNKQLWVLGKDGQPIQETKDLLEAAGIEALGV